MYVVAIFGLGHRKSIYKTTIRYILQKIFFVLSINGFQNKILQDRSK